LISIGTVEKVGIGNKVYLYKTSGSHIFQQFPLRFLEVENPSFFSKMEREVGCQGRICITLN